MDTAETKAAGTDRDRSLLEGLFRGGRKESREFFQAFAPLVFSVAGRIDCKDPSLSKEELVNEAFLHLFADDFRRLRSFKFGSRLSTYIYTVARRRMLEKVAGAGPLPRAGEWDGRPSGYSAELDWGMLDAADPETERARSENLEERERVLATALRRLEPAELLQWKYHEDGRSVEEMVGLLGFKDRARLDKAKFLLLEKMRKEIRRIREGEGDAR